jgi:transposase-like protein
LIPVFDGAIFSLEWKDALWDKFFTSAPQQLRQSVEQYKNSHESLRALSGRYGINQKTVVKWRKRSTVSNSPTGPKNPKSTILMIEEEAIVSKC